MQKRKNKKQPVKIEKIRESQFNSYTPGQPFGIRKNREKNIKNQNS